MWEAVFMLLVLKIPVVYLGLVVWWSIREPKPEEPALVAVVADTPPGLGPTPARDRRLHRGPERPGPVRRPPNGRLTRVRTEARR